MGPFDNPVDLIVYMLEKTRAVGAFDRVVGMFLLVIAAPLMKWPRRKSRIIRYLVAERLTAFKPHGYPARELGRKTGREALVWFHADLKEKALDVRLRNSFGVELCRLNIAIKQGNRQQVGKAMIGVFLGMDVGLWTEASTASCRS